MSHRIEFDLRSTYLFARVTGTNTTETVKNYMRDVLAKCEEMGCFYVLIHECLEGPRLSTSEVFTLVSEGSQEALGRFSAIAFVDEQMGDVGRFAENVGVNRGIPLMVFNEVGEATRWIEQRAAESA